MYNLINDLSSLTTIPAPTLNKLGKLAAQCACNCVEESLLEGSNRTDINVGIGVLQIISSDNDLKYRFVPSKEFNAAVQATVVDRKNPLALEVEDLLVKRILDVYKSYM